MCECCGPLELRKRTPEEQAEHERVMAEFRSYLDNRLAWQGTTVEAVLDPERYGTRRRRFGTWLQDIFFNIRIAFGWV